ncbi:MAG TPA: DUF2585 domain-containing protein [Sphingomonas sp.]|nr:DUF2585 domain-containing protein [Sphingomonas sp.]
MARMNSWALAALMVAAAAAGIELAMGRSPFCPCGHFALWHGIVQSNENSQQLTDWYSFSHIIHGFLLYGAAWLLLRGASLPARLFAAVSIESAWEVLENSPVIIDRYRAVTMAYGYSGDSVLNSMSDIACMAIGFVLARALPWWATVVIAVLLELFTLAAIRDNLTLNVLMLVAPSAAIRAWQTGA